MKGKCKFEEKNNMKPLQWISIERAPKNEFKYEWKVQQLKTEIFWIQKDTQQRIDK